MPTKSTTRFVTWLLAILTVAAIVAFLAVVPRGLVSYERDVELIKGAVDFDQLRQWSLSVVERHQVIPKNAGGLAGLDGYELPAEAIPDWVRRIPSPASPWIVVVRPALPGRQAHVELVSLGGFQSYGLAIGTTSFICRPNQGRVVEVAPGIYFLWTAP